MFIRQLEWNEMELTNNANNYTHSMIETNANVNKKCEINGFRRRKLSTSSERTKWTNKRPKYNANTLVPMINENSQNENGMANTSATNNSKYLACLCNDNKNLNEQTIKRYLMFDNVFALPALCVRITIRQPLQLFFHCLPQFQQCQGYCGSVWKIFRPLK